MAVLDSLPHIKSQIWVDGRPLEEFDDDEDEEQEVGPIAEYKAARTVTKYIESTSDKEYSVKLEIDTSYNWDSPCPSTELGLMEKPRGERSYIQRRPERLADLKLLVIQPSKVSRSRMLGKVAEDV
jgi:hypothetical protein